MLNPQIELPLTPVIHFLIVLARVGGMMTFAPFWSLEAASKQVRVMIAMTLSLLVTLIVSPRLGMVPTNLVSLAMIITGELLIGCAIGFAGRLVMSTFEFAAHLLSAQMGFSLASIIDPATRAQTTAIGTAAHMLALVLLLAIDGHYWFLTATIKSFYTIAPGNLLNSWKLMDLFLHMSAQLLAGGVALAAPAIVLLMTVEFLIAVTGRIAPQLQIFLLGFPIKIAVGLWLLGASLYFLPNAFRHILINIKFALARVLAAN